MTDAPIENATESLSASDDPNPNLGSESPVAGNLEATPPDGTPETTETDPETAKNVRVARALADATKKERRAAERERRAAESVRQAEARIKQAEAARDELTALLTDAAKDPDRAMALLKKAGIPSVEALARLVLKMDQEPEAPSDIANRALKEANDLREQLQRERDEAALAKRQAEFNNLYRQHMAKVNDVIDSAGEDFALVKDNNLQSEVLRRIYTLLQEKNIVDVSQDEEVLLVKHFASEVEAELAPKAQSVLDRLTKIKKLAKLGINPNLIAGTTDPASNSTNSESLDPDALAKAASAIREGSASTSVSTNPTRPSKFITNENTVSSKPLPRSYNLGRKDEDAIQQALRAMESK